MVTRQDNWEAVKALFEAALEEDSARRPSFLKERCPDVNRRAEVERLLAEHDQAGAFLSTPAMRNVPTPNGLVLNYTKKLKIFDLPWPPLPA
jgi:hypothetical protein